jgi:hypothetical protein
MSTVNVRMKNYCFNCATKWEKIYEINEDDCLGRYVGKVFTIIFINANLTFRPPLTPPPPN